MGFFQRDLHSWTSGGVCRGRDFQNHLSPSWLALDLFLLETTLRWSHCAISWRGQVFYERKCQADISSRGYGSTMFSCYYTFYITLIAVVRLYGLFLNILMFLYICSFLKDSGLSSFISPRNHFSTFHIKYIVKCFTVEITIPKSQRFEDAGCMKKNTDDAVEQVIEARGQTETCHQFCARNTKSIL